jgi:hypothetical protein
MGFYFFLSDSNQINIKIYLILIIPFTSSNNIDIILVSYDCSLLVVIILGYASARKSTLSGPMGKSRRNSHEIILLIR